MLNTAIPAKTLSRLIGQYCGVTITSRQIRKVRRGMGSSLEILRTLDWDKIPTSIIKQQEEKLAKDAELKKMDAFNNKFRKALREEAKVLGTDHSFEATAHVNELIAERQQFTYVPDPECQKLLLSRREYIKNIVRRT